MSNLTSLQQGLIDGLIKEFTKINPKPSTNGAKRFSFDTIAECQKEEERFLSTIRKHNDTMIKVFDKQLKDELKAFEKEFGKAFTTQMGYTYRGNNNPQNTYDQFITANKGNVVNNYNHSEMYLFIASKTNAYKGESRCDYCNGKAHTKLQVDFKREKVTTKLDSGKEVYAWKIIGLEFISHEYLHRDNTSCIKTATLDEYIQTNKQLQAKMVEMAS